MKIRITRNETPEGSYGQLLKVGEVYEARWLQDNDGCHLLALGPAATEVIVDTDSFDLGDDMEWVVVERDPIPAMDMADAPF